MNIGDELPKSDVNKEFYIQNVERQLAASTDGATAAGALGKSKGYSEVLLRLARTTPYYKRNRPHICSFWVKGECKRGEECPYRHERPTDPDDPLADQNIKDRYYGTNDPVADKLLKRASTMPALDPPDDRSITTLYVGNLGERIGELELRDHFYQYGEIRSINIVSKHQYAFIQFVTRSGAELAAEKTYNKLILNNRRINIKWGRSQGRPGIDDDDNEENNSNKEMEPVPGLPSLPPPPEELQNNYFNLASSIPLPPGQAPMGMPDDENEHRPLQPPPLPPPGSIPLRPPPMGVGPFPPRPGLPPPLQPPPFLPPHVRPALRPPPLRPPPFLQQPPPIPGIGPPPAAIGQGVIHYPSQDPTQMGATPDKN